MNSIEDILIQYITEKFDRNQLIFLTLLLKFEQKGIELSSEQELHLKQQIDDQVPTDKNNGDTFSLNIHLDEIDLDEEVKEFIGKITEDDFRIIENRIHDALREVTFELISTEAENLLLGWKGQADELLAESRHIHSDFRNNLYSAWRTPLDLLEMLIGTSLDAGNSFNHQNRPKASKDNDIKFEVLTRLHARSCQVAQEILTLLSNGFADGAHARWRTLHELSVIMWFIDQNDEEVANRYLQHGAIKAYKDAQQYQKHCEALGRIPFSKDEMKYLKTQHDSLVKKYGNDFKGQYGWAFEVLGIRRPNFTHIEEAVNLNHLQPFVRMAHINVHATVRGAFLRLGLQPDMDLLLAGGSIYGLGEPGRNTASSLTTSSIILLFSKLGLENLIYGNALLRLRNEIHEAFYEAEYDSDQSYEGNE